MIDEISGGLLQWLRGFCSVAEHGSVWQAAIAMGREKSTISRQIQCLEKELGVTLFDRSSGKMIITPEGKILLEEAVGLLLDVKRITGRFKNEEINYQGKILIAATHVIIYSILPPYIKQFRKLHPEVTFKFEGAIHGMVLEKVESAEVDFGIAFFETGHKTLVNHYLYEAGLIMIAPKDNSFFPGKTLPTLKQIAEAPLILFEHRGFHEPLIERRFAEEQLKPNVIMTHNNFVNIKKYVAHGMGIAILGGHAISQEDENNFDIYSLDQYFPKRKYAIILNKKKYLSPMVKALIRTIKPDIDFSANLDPSEEATTLSLPELLRRWAELNRAEAPTVKAGSGKKR
jgi:DNA-binding transcriptional LysR family regulator